MYTINFEQPIHVHFIGIGGISMSGLAEVLMQEGFTISGSDMHESDLTKRLSALGAKVFYGQKASNIEDGVDLVVYTAAIREDNEEFAEVKRRGLPLLSRAQLLGQMMKNYETSIAVSGTHGKTTSTSMLSHILLETDCDPTISVGGILKAIQGNIRVGSSKVFLTEACEYTDSFLEFFPKIGIILNIDKDHLDYFKDLDHIRRSFKAFAELLPEEGALIISDEIPDLSGFCEGLACPVFTFGWETSSDYYADHVTHDDYGNASFDVYKKGQLLGRVSLKVAGDHNVLNALSSIAAADLMDIPWETMKKGLESFGGTDRRFQIKGEVNGFTIIDDYAHHPTEIQATLAAAANYPHKDLWVVFQPHTFSRTKALFDEFVDTLRAADHIVLADIYAAREKDNLGVSSEMLARALAERGADAYYLPSFEAIEAFFLDTLKEGDVLITMGAGDVVNIADDLVNH